MRGMISVCTVLFLSEQRSMAWIVLSRFNPTWSQARETARYVGHSWCARPSTFLGLRLGFQLGAHFCKDIPISGIERGLPKGDQLVLQFLSIRGASGDQTCSVLHRLLICSQGRLPLLLHGPELFLPIFTNFPVFEVEQSRACNFV